MTLHIDPHHRGAGDADGDVRLADPAAFMHWLNYQDRPVPLPRSVCENCPGARCAGCPVLDDLRDDLQHWDCCSDDTDDWGA